ncbi:hypothetical protein H4R23_000367 [Coemansia sp. Cherry 401B]|nr:hypothetical protein H4R23_000367 [Coemansia sp. Cherry 401B]
MGVGISSLRTSKDAAAARLSADNKQALATFLESLQEEGFSAYLRRYLTDADDDKALPQQHLGHLLSDDRVIQTDAMYALAGLGADKPSSLEAFVECVCQAAMKRFWNGQAGQLSADGWLAAWALTRPKGALLQVYGNSESQKQQLLKHNSLGITMAGLDDESSSKHLEEWLADAALPGHVSADAWRVWWQHSAEFHELVCLALSHTLYPRQPGPAADSGLVRLPRIAEHNLRGPQLDSAHTSDLLSLATGWALSRELPQEARLNWAHVYSSKHDGRSWSTFKKAIERRGSLLVLVREMPDEGCAPRVFGTYIDNDLTRNPSWHGSSLNLLFTIHPGDKLPPGPVVYRTTGFNDHYQYFNYTTKTLPNGFGVGGQLEHFGLWIDSGFTKGHSNAAATFDSQPLSTHTEFTIDAIEAWLVRPTQRLDSDDEEGAQKSAVESNPEAAAMLEMANRTMYSKQLPLPTADMETN